MTGSIRPGRLPGTWELRVSLGRDPLTGKYPKMSRTFHGGKKAAEKELARLVTEVDGGRSGSSSATVGQAVDAWLDHVADKLSPTTIRGYRGYNRRYIQPALGTKLLRKLKAEDLDRFYNALARDHKPPLAPATCHQVHAIVRSALTQAVRWGWLSINPAVLATAPSVPRSQLRAPDIDTYRQVLAEARKIGPDLATFLRTAAASGARRAEVCGLRWYDLDHDGGLVVTRSIVMDDDTKELVVKDTKTGHGRPLYLDAGTIAELDAHRARMDARAAEAHLKLMPAAYIFSDSLDGSEPWRPDRVSLAFYRIKTRLGLEVRLHDLRHMHATQLLTGGGGKEDPVDLRTVAGRLGHDPAVTMRIYGDRVPAADRRAADIMGRLLDAPTESQP